MKQFIYNLAVIFLRLRELRHYHHVMLVLDLAAASFALWMFAAAASVVMATVWTVCAAVCVVLIATRLYRIQNPRGPRGEIIVRGRNLREVETFLRCMGLTTPLQPGTHYISAAVVAHPTGYLVVDVKHKQVA